MLVCRVSLRRNAVQFITLMTNHPKSRTLSSVILVVLLVIAWAVLAPAQFGGQTAYVIISGNSMWPTLDWDDLVVLRQASAYQVNDIVAYRDPQVGPVIHRIIQKEGDRFVFQGDHNDFIDPYHPTQDELIGKLWVRLPVVGRYVETVRTPHILTLIASVIGMIAMSTVVAPSKGKKNKRKRRPASHSSARPISANITDVLLASGTLAVASLVLAVFAFTRPTHYSTTEDIDYWQTGTFSYSATVPPGIYDSETVQPGEPIFRRLTDEMTVSFEYNLTTDLPGTVHGVYRLIAEISGVNGWKRTLELQPETVFDRAFSTSSTIYLSDIQALLDNFEQQVEIHRNTYRIAIISEVSVNGQIAGQTLEDTFAPRLVFELGDLQLQLVASDTDPLKPSQSGKLSRTVIQPNSLSILGLELEVSTARAISLAALTISVSVTEVLGMVAFYTARQGEAAKIQLKYGSMLIPVQDGNLAANTKRRIVSVGSIDGLAKIAETNGSMILHLTRGNESYYLVQVADALYCYRTSNSNNRQLQSTTVLQADGV